MNNGSPREFGVGQVVRRRNAPDSVGVIRTRRFNEQTEEWLYEVQFGTGVRFVPGDDIEELPEQRNMFQDLADGRVEGAAVLRRLLTFERLRRPPTRIAASFGTARANLLPYQFKPLLKFLENRNRRLLIADDVGLGKTIEAGYILREFRAQHPVDRVLIVVPARLRTKWQAELSRRFDESFEIVRAQDIRLRLFDHLRRNQELRDFAWITSYEAIRQEDLRESFRALQPSIDLVVLDEAHRVRNKDTLQHRIARSLGNCADAMIFLTATPVQTSRENLFQLLSILEPESFKDIDVFERQLDANKPVVKALAALRVNPPDRRAAIRELNRLADDDLTQKATQGRFFQAILDRLSSTKEPSRRTLVEVQRDVSELGFLAQVLSRTRKVEVMIGRPERKPQAVRVSLSPEEQNVYWAVAAAAQLITPATSNWGATMAVLMALRYTASCIPAALQYFRSRLYKAAAVVNEVREVTEDESGWRDSPAPKKNETQGTQAVWGEISTRLEAALSGVPVDSKFEKFREALDGIWKDDRCAGRRLRKVVVFAFFKPTLRYLSNRLTEQNVIHRLITGDVSISERENRIDEFLSDPGILVLLSSEVGSEGLDLQEASVVVNYDLPWNPMVVEQRIGRVDRIGQRSPAIAIINLILEGTVEDTILNRLYERIGLFRETIGEIEPILGRQVEKLALSALRGELNQKEQSRRAEQAADAFHTGQSVARHLQQEVDQLIAGDQAFLDEVEALLGEHRIPGVTELHQFLVDFLHDSYHGSYFPQTSLHKVSEIKLSKQVASDLLQHLGTTPDARRFSTKIEEGRLHGTFNTEIHLRHPKSELFSIHHPLVRFALEEMSRKQETLHRAFRVQIPAHDRLATGDYLVQVLQYELGGVRPRNEMRSIVWSLDHQKSLDDETAQRFFVGLLEDAETLEAPSGFEGHVCMAAAERLRDHADKVYATLKTTETDLNAVRAERQRATQEVTLHSKVRAAQRAVENLKRTARSEFPIRMASARLKNAQQRLDFFLDESSPSTQARIEESEVAVIHVRVS